MKKEWIKPELENISVSETKCWTPWTCPTFKTDDEFTFSSGQQCKKKEKHKSCGWNFFSWCKFW